MAYRIEINKLRKKLSYDLVPKEILKIQDFVYTFQEGNCYALNLSNKNGWLISECFTGRINSHNFNIYVNEKKLSNIELQKLSIPVGCPVKKGLFKESFYDEIKRLHLSNSCLNNLMKKYGISENRMQRPYSQTSSERWRMSFALGSLINKKIYCFPWVTSELMDMYTPLWLRDFIDGVKLQNGIILIPTDVTEKNKDLFDIVIK